VSFSPTGDFAYIFSNDVLEGNLEFRAAGFLAGSEGKESASVNSERKIALVESCKDDLINRYRGREEEATERSRGRRGKGRGNW
jgi:hypothetical protein